jgi:hypothetical protein
MKRLALVLSAFQLIAYSILLLSLILDAPYLAEISFPVKGLAFIILFLAVFSGLNQLIETLIRNYEREADTKIPFDNGPFGERDELAPPEFGDKERYNPKRPDWF